MENILNEHYVTVTNNNDMNKYVDIVVNVGVGESPLLSFEMGVFLQNTTKI